MHFRNVTLDLRMHMPSLDRSIFVELQLVHEATLRYYLESHAKAQVEDWRCGMSALNLIPRTHSSCMHGASSRKPCPCVTQPILACGRCSPCASLSGVSRGLWAKLGL